MPTSARWGLAAVGTIVLSLILLGLGAGLHSPLLAWLALACVLTGFAVAGVASAKGRTRNRG
jgi:hypothetical protein